MCAQTTTHDDEQTGSLGFEQIGDAGGSDHAAVGC
jgi:hypothetical protein